MSTLLVLLPPDPSGPVRCMQVDTGGSVLQRWRVESSGLLPAGAHQGVTRTVVGVPGTDVRTLWLPLAAGNPLQVLAAAHALLEDHASGAQDSQHVAIAAGDPALPRLVAVAARQAMLDWLQRCAALSVVPDVMIPDYLLLPAPAAADELLIAVDAERWLVRGAGRAFSAEAGLARQVLEPREMHVEPDAARLERMLAEGAAAEPAINLLQYEFAPMAAPRGGPSRRRLAVFALALLLSPALLVAADALRYHFTARSLDQEAAAMSASTESANGAGPAAATGAGAMTAAAQARVRNVLLEAISRSPGVRLQTLGYGAGAALSADLVHATPEQLQALGVTLLQSGLRLEAGASVGEGSELRTTVRLERQP